MSSNTTERLYGIWGSSPSDVFAVGWHGTILHYDGLVEAQLFGDPLSRLWGGSDAHDQCHRVRRSQANQCKDHHGHQEQHRNGNDQFFEKVFQHGSL